MCEHSDCEHSLGPGSHCNTCDRLEREKKRFEDVKLPVDGKCGYCGTEISSCAAGEFCPNPDCGYIDGYYRRVKRTYADIRKTDPAIRAIIIHAASVNIQKIDIEAIEKILTEGADGRYLQDTEV